jgi:cyclophilin family peptidyl-prolyl cis-trans isomerase
MLFEQLENRVMLGYDPVTFPVLADLVEADNTVVRFNTTLGFVDIELFDQAGPNGTAGTAAPNTAANFLNYVFSGRWDGTFFHRMVELGNDPDLPDEILQGGGFTFTDDDGVVQVEQDDPIANEFSMARSNLARTIAMAKLSGDPDSATNQWYVNLVDNNTGTPQDGNLDLINGGFTVFGRIANDASWDVIMDIVMLDTFVFADVEVDDQGDWVRNVNNQPIPLPGGDPLSFAFTDVPVTQNIMGPPPGELRFDFMSEDVLVYLEDAEVIKQADAGEFYTRTLAMPEGFASPRVIEYLDLTNADPNEEVFYQVVLRYETGARDQVIASGMLTPSGSTTIVVHDRSQQDADVRPVTPYAFEIQTTSVAGGTGASLLHRDFGNYAAEQFIAPETYTGSELREWNFTAVQKLQDSVHSFVLFQNLSDQPATVTATFFDINQDGAEAILVFELDAFRRGGIDVANTTQLSDRVYGVRIESTQPIAAAAAQYQTIMPAELEINNSSLTAGVAGGGSTSLVIPTVTATAEGISEIRLMNTSGTNALVRVSATRANGTNFILQNVNVLTGTINVVNLVTRVEADILSEGEEITIDIFSVTGAPVSAQFRTASDGDFASTAAALELSTATVFSGLFFDPDDSTGVVDTLTIFNPLLETARYRIDVIFADGTRINGSFVNLAAFTRVDFTLDTLPNAAALIDQITQNPANMTFSLVVATVADLGAPGGVVQMTRVDNNLGFTWTSLGRNVGGQVPLDFQPGNEG